MNTELATILSENPHFSRLHTTNFLRVIRTVTAKTVPRRNWQLLKRFSEETF